jgi:hypothetical protein
MKTKKKVEADEELRNAQELDEKAGVGRAIMPSVKPIDVTRPANALPLVKTNTREKLLYKLACMGTPIGDEFFDQFPDRQEVLELSLDISARLLIVAILNSEMPATQRIASMRVVASLAGKNVPDPEDEPGFKPASAPLAIPRGSKEEVANTLDKIRQLSQ